MKIASVLSFLSVACALLQPALAVTHNLKIRTLDESGAPFPNVLVIVRSLTTNLELARSLTNVNGDIPVVSSSGGPLQIIATCPYGICRTAVSEYLAEALPEHLVLKVPMRSTDELGELIGSPKVSVIVSSRSPERKPLVEVELLVRDAGAIRQQWYRPDPNGQLSITLLDDETWLIFFANGQVARYVLAHDCGHLSLARNPIVTCVKTGSSEVRIYLP